MRRTRALSVLTAYQYVCTCIFVRGERGDKEERRREGGREGETREGGKRKERGGKEINRGGGPLTFTPSLILNTLPWFLHLFEYMMRMCEYVWSNTYYIHSIKLPQVSRNFSSYSWKLSLLQIFLLALARRI